LREEKHTIGAVVYEVFEERRRKKQQQQKENCSKTRKSEGDCKVSGLCLSSIVTIKALSVRGNASYYSNTHINNCLYLYRERESAELSSRARH
jgi:hypothetical protein